MGLNKGLMKINVSYVIFSLAIFLKFYSVGTYLFDYEPMDSISMCKGIPAFIRRNTNLKCSDDIGKMQIYYNASLRATYDCQKHFKMRRWNCSSNPVYLSKLILHSIPETSYLYAIHSAALAHSFMYACASGLTSGCRCSPKPSDNWYNRGNQLFIEEFACANTYVRYGIELSRKLLENNVDSDPIWLINNHNKEAGRLALLSRDIPKRDLCRCQGVSGACAIKKCVRRLPNFSAIGEVLIKKYFAAVKVSVDNDVKFLLPYTDSMKAPTEADLVYAQDGPDFCENNKYYGSLGTAGRECEKSHDSPGACDVLCCDRGYHVKKQNITELCNCRFTYCCSVKCATCNKTLTTYTCK